MATCVKTLMKATNLGGVLKEIYLTLNSSNKLSVQWESVVSTQLDTLHFILSDADTNISEHEDVIIKIFSHLKQLIETKEASSSESLNPNIKRRAALNLGAIYCYVPSNLQLEFVKDVTSAIEAYSLDVVTHEDNLVTLIKILASTAKHDIKKNDEEKRQVYLSVSKVFMEMFVSNEHVVGHIFAQLISLLFEMKCISPEQVWEITLTIHKEHGQHTYITKSVDQLAERPCFLLCGTADWLFPVDGLGDIGTKLLNNGEFWRLLQCGFWNEGTLTRKRSMYLLKRILDICDKNNIEIDINKDSLFSYNPKMKQTFGKVWDDFILLMEALEEKQVHVIKPLMPRIQNLISASNPHSKLYKRCKYRTFTFRVFSVPLNDIEGL